MRARRAPAPRAGGRARPGRRVLGDHRQGGQARGDASRRAQRAGRRPWGTGHRGRAAQARLDARREVPSGHTGCRRRHRDLPGSPVTAHKDPSRACFRPVNVLHRTHTNTGRRNFLVPLITSVEMLHLTEREEEILFLAANGYTTRATAELLDLAPGTVDAELVHIYDELGVGDRADAVAVGARLGLV